MSWLTRGNFSQLSLKFHSHFSEPEIKKEVVAEVDPNPREPDAQPEVGEGAQLHPVLTPTQPGDSLSGPLEYQSVTFLDLNIFTI